MKADRDSEVNVINLSISSFRPTLLFKNRRIYYTTYWNGAKKFSTQWQQQQNQQKSSLVCALFDNSNHVSCRRPKKNHPLQLTPKKGNEKKNWKNNKKKVQQKNPIPKHLIPLLSSSPARNSPISENSSLPTIQRNGIMWITTTFPNKQYFFFCCSVLYTVDVRVRFRERRARARGV